MDANKKAVADRFDRWAGSYERDRRSRFNAAPQRAALESLALVPSDRFLDVGCGSGAAVRAAAASVERAVGVDLSPAMIDRARALAAGVAGTEFVVGDSEHLPFPPETFTAVLCSSSFHHYPQPTRALTEMARVLAPGGRLAIADGAADVWTARLADRLLRRLDSGHVRLYPSGELVALVRGAGFVDVAVSHLRNRGYMVVSARRPSGEAEGP